MKLAKCENCRHYKQARIGYLGSHGRTGTCLDKTYPANKVRGSWHCTEHQLKQPGENNEI